VAFLKASANVRFYVGFRVLIWTDNDMAFLQFSQASVQRKRMALRAGEISPARATCVCAGRKQTRLRSLDVGRDERAGNDKGGPERN